MKYIEQLKKKWTRAQIHLWTFEDLLSSPAEALQTALSTTGTPARDPLINLPKMHDLTGFNEFLRELQNQGMHPYAIGNISALNTEPRKKPAIKPYLKK